MALDPVLIDGNGIEKAGVILRCRDFSANLTFFTDTLGFRVETIHPADGPTHASLIGHDCRLLLEPGADQPLNIRLVVQPTSALHAQTHTAPNGSIIKCVPAQPDMSVVPLVSLSLSNTRIQMGLRKLVVPGCCTATSSPADKVERLSRR